MPQFPLDTAHLTLYEPGHDAVVARARDGVARVGSYARLLGTVQLLAEFVLVPFDQASEAAFQQLNSQKLRLGTQDLKIAAVALAHRLVLLTRNRSDFVRITT